MLNKGAEPSLGGRHVILIVDDEYALLQLLRETLSGEFEVETASSAEEAEMLLASRDYDAVVCDHMLPGEQGLDFLIRASRLHPFTRRILLTGYINPDFISRSHSLAKLSACVLKPASQAALCAEVRRVLRS